MVISKKSCVLFLCLLHAVGVYCSEKKEKTVVQLTKEIARGERNMFGLLTTGALSNDKEIKDFSVYVLSGWADLQKRELELRVRPRISYEEMQLVRTHGTPDEQYEWFKNEHNREKQEIESYQKSRANFTNKLEKVGKVSNPDSAWDDAWLIDYMHGILAYNYIRSKGTEKQKAGLLDFELAKKVTNEDIKFCEFVKKQSLTGRYNIFKRAVSLCGGREISNNEINNALRLLVEKFTKKHLLYQLAQLKHAWLRTAILP